MHMRVLDLGLIDYKKAWEVQKEVFDSVKNLLLPQTVILCQHPSVVTLGRRADKDNILAGNRQLSSAGITVYEIERGGDVTYHGPGQLVIYPILDLNNFRKDIRFFLRYLEDVVIGALGELGIKGERVYGATGVWVGGRKIASIGISIKSWISFHGLSINIKEGDLANFSLIRPCGMDIKMTSVETELGRDIEISDIKELIIHKFRDTLPIGRLGVPA